MHVSQKLEYALRALLELAIADRPGAIMRSAVIASRAGVPEKYLEAILVSLNRADLVSSRRGPEGGHRLGRPPAGITVYDVYEAIEGPLRLAERARRRHRSRADADIEAAVGGLWFELEGALRGVLEGVTLEDLRRRAEIRREVPDFVI